MKIVSTAAGGGFLWQSRNVAQGIAGVGELHFISGEPAANLDRTGFPPGRWHEVPAVTIQADRRHLVRRACNLLRTFGHCFAILRALRPDAIVCVATSMAIPLCLCGRLMGARTVFVESITRVNVPSVTGKVLSGLRLCDRIYVQWPEAVSLYRGAVYRGTLL